MQKYKIPVELYVISVFYTKTNTSVSDSTINATFGKKIYGRDKV